MTTIQIKETPRLSGTLQAPSSKSYTHRAILTSFLSKGQSRITDPLLCDDTLATLNACLRLGAQVKREHHTLLIHGSKLKASKDPIDCYESASTLRFLTPIAGLVKGETILDGEPSLRRRPIQPLITALNSLGVTCSSSDGFPPVTVYGKGKIWGGQASIVGDISSQFITGLLLACPFAEHDTQLWLTTPLESRPYVDLTLNILEKHNIDVEVSPKYRHFKIPRTQQYVRRDHSVPGDFSSSAFLMAAAAITSSTITFSNLPPGLPDDQIVDILKKMNVNVQVEGGTIHVTGGELVATDIDSKDIPDLIPPCTVLACFAHGETKIYNATRLRIKESDRLETLHSALSNMGATITESKDGLRVNGPCRLKGATIDHQNDHRIAMACAIAGLKAKGITIIPNTECVNKSYPTFFNDLKHLGANVCVT